MEKQVPVRGDYRWFTDISTRWADNDIYGHVNNVAYYAYFDTAANEYLIRVGGLDIHRADTIGVVVESRCNYFAPLAYPERLEAGVRVEQLGNRSVRYGIAIFRKGDAQAAAAGHFVHVFVRREGMSPVAIPAPLREALARIQADPA